jgi:hypothetical protein
MSKINVGRVLLGGLVAGVVLNIGEFLLHGVLLSKALEEDFRRLNLSPPGNDFIIKAVIITFILGIAVVYLYAAIIPRFGAGMKTAVWVGVISWFFVYLYSGYINQSLGLVSANLYLIGLGWGLVEYIVSAMAGAWLYKES